MRPIFKDPALQIEFEDKGYVIVDFLSPDEVSALTQAYTKLDGQPKQAGFSTSNMSPDVSYRREASKLVIQAFEQAVDHYFDRCKQFMGIFTSKQPNQAASTCSMHQDPSLVDEEKFHSMTIWVPLVDTCEHNGALQVIDRSQLLNPHPRATFVHFPYRDLVPLFCEKHFKTVEIKAGQAYLGSSKVFHWSPPNYSDQERVAALAWLAEEESQLRCYYQNFRQPGERLEVFEVVPEYYIEAPLFSRPDETTAKKIGEVPYHFEPLDEAKIARLLQLTPEMAH